MVKNVQFMRALAAYGVVVHHIIFTLNDYIFPAEHIARRIIINIGAFGVDLFFVISGFVMAETISRGDVRPMRFAGHRIARVVPTYWLLTIVAALAILAGVKLFGGPPINAETVTDSLFFIPQFDAAGHRFSPIVYVGWSLNFEMFFYALVTCALFVPAQWLRWPLVWGALLLFMLAAHLIHNRVLGYYGDPKILEFALGALIWHAMRKNLQLPSLAAWAGIALSIAALIGAHLVHPGSSDPVAIWSTCGAVLLTCALALEKNGLKADWRWAQFQGNASYSVYLLHPFLLQFIAKIAIAIGLTHSFAGRIATMILMLAIVAACAALFYKAVEKPVTRYARRLVDKVTSKDADGPGKPALASAAP